MAKRGSGATSITLEKGEDGSWTLPQKGVRGKVGQIVRGSGIFDPSVGTYRDLATGLVSGPGMYAHPPVPNSIGRWRGKGTKNDPYRWVGVSEKLAATAVGVALVVWGLECLEVDVSNWWATSTLNLDHDLSYFQNIGASVLGSLGFPVATDSKGNVTAVGARQHATFFTWLFQNVMVQGGDLAQGAATIGGLSVGTGPTGIGSPPPAPGASSPGQTLSGGSGGLTSHSGKSASSLLYGIIGQLSGVGGSYPNFTGYTIQYGSSIWSLGMTSATTDPPNGFQVQIATANVTVILTWNATTGYWDQVYYSSS